MTQLHRDIVLKQLYDAFALVEKPTPLTAYEGSCWDQGVDVFNATDWEAASYTDFANGVEGAIICPAITKLYLIPRLFKILLLERGGEHEGAEVNLTAELEGWPKDEAVEDLLSDGQKRAIIDAWNFMEFCLYGESDIPMAQNLANRWSIPW